MARGTNSNPLGVAPRCAAHDPLPKDGVPPLPAWLGAGYRGRNAPHDFGCRFRHGAIWVIMVNNVAQPRTAGRTNRSTIENLERPI